jgi:periplasmic protein TonB
MMRWATDKADCLGAILACMMVTIITLGASGPTTGPEAAPATQPATQATAPTTGPATAPAAGTSATLAERLPFPEYPRESRIREEQGVVTLEVDVLSDGTVGSIKVISDGGFTRLSDAAIAAVRKGKFKPATENGKPVASRVRIPFQFVLQPRAK